MTEKQFMQTVVDMARLLGWKVFHAFDSRRSEPGFPDLVLVRDRIVHLELKTDSGRVSPQQADWIAAINAAGGNALVVRPSDMGEIEKALKLRVDREAVGVAIHGPITVVAKDPSAFVKGLQRIAKEKKDEAA